MSEPGCRCDACLHGHPVEEQDLLTVSVGRPTDAVVVVRATGDIDLLTAPSWERALRDAVELLTPAHAPAGTGPPAPGRAPELVCDLDAVTFLGAAALSVLVAVDDVARASGVVLVAIATRGRARRVLDLTGTGARLHRRTALGDSRATTPQAPTAASRLVPPGNCR